MKKIFFLIIICLILSSCGKKDVFQNEISVESFTKSSVLLEPTLNPGGYFELSNNLIGWGLKKNVKAPPEVPESLCVLLEKYNSYYIGKDEKVLYLTFDEGYENGHTAEILDVLKEKNVPAAFFITMPYLKKEKELVKRMVDEGHIVGNHTVNHPSLPSLPSIDEIASELTALDNEFYAEFGKRMKFFRAPRGEFSERTLAATSELGYVNVFWSFAYKDWETKNQKGSDYAYNEILNGIHNGCILLLHAVSVDNAKALPAVIDALKDEGYVFMSLDNLVN